MLTPLDIVVVSVYVAGLLAMLSLSATYNLWPVSPTKWVLRRLRSLGDLCADRCDLYACYRRDEAQRCLPSRC